MKSTSHMTNSVNRTYGRIISSIEHRLNKKRSPETDDFTSNLYAGLQSRGMGSIPRTNFFARFGGGKGRTVGP